MKKLIFILILISSSITAQIKGNKNIETRTFSVENLAEIKINLYAKITIDQSAKEGITITADSNLFDKIDTKVIDGKLRLNQLEWIQPSKNIIITINVKNLKRVETGTHQTVNIINVDAEYLNIMALVGKVVISGKVEQLNIGAEIGEVDASKLIADNARVNIWSRGKATIYVENEIYSIIKNDGELVLVNQPKVLKGDAKKVLAKIKKMKTQK